MLYILKDLSDESKHKLIFGDSELYKFLKSISNYKLADEEDISSHIQYLRTYCNYATLKIINEPEESNVLNLNKLLIGLEFLDLLHPIEVKEIE